MTTPTDQPPTTLDLANHPSAHCHSCLDYLDHRGDLIVPHIVAAARRRAIPAQAMAAEFMTEAHRRHQRGYALRKGGPTRTTDPFLGRTAALAALIADSTTETR